MNRKEAILDAASNRWRETFEAIGVRFAQNARGVEQMFHCPCANHKNNDQNPSAHLNVDSGLWKCEVTKKGGDVFHMVGLIFGLTTFPEKMTKLEEVVGVSSQNGRPPKKKVAETYQYTDEDGTLLYEVVRFDPKDFRQRRPDGEGNWIWGLSADEYWRKEKGRDWYKFDSEKHKDGERKHFPEVQRVLYLLPNLKGQEIAYLPEGELDVNRIWKIGIPATCGSAGAGKWREEYVEQLKAAGIENIVVLPDNDGPGEKTCRHGGEFVL